MMPFRLVLSLAVVCVTVDAVAADDAQPTPEALTAPSVQAGPITLTPGGFFELSAIYRTRNETADVGSTFSGVPFRNNSNYYISEFRQTARNSRLSLLARSALYDRNQVEGYVEGDFLGVGTASNSIESNSYTFRVRQAFLGWARPDMGWAVTAGQAWSLVTLYAHGLSPREEDIPLGDEASYQTGFAWARQPQLRIVKTFSPSVALGLSLEGPQNLVRGTAPDGTVATNPGGPLLNSLAPYSTDVAPDAIVKLALDPRYGHFEVYSLTRWLRDRAPAVPGALSSTTSHTTVAQSFGGGLIWPLWGKWLDLHASTLIGHGNGRYGSAQLPDSTYNTLDGSLSALREQQALVGLVGHLSRTFDLYAYSGLEQQTGGYTLTPANNLACNVNVVDLGSLPPGAACGGVGRVRQVSAGFMWKFYQGTLGYLVGGPEIEYVKDTTYTARDGTSADTNDTFVFLTLRYYPFQ